MSANVFYRHPAAGHGEGRPACCWGWVIYFQGKTMGYIINGEAWLPLVFVLNTS